MPILCPRFFCAILLANLLIPLISASEIPILQPGAPGEPTRKLDAETAVNIANSSYSVADVEFMQDMIIHHQQALIMSRLAALSTNNEVILELAARIDVSQADEISFMQDWLHEREQHAPDPNMEQRSHLHHSMVGMATPAQIKQLSVAKSKDFDKLFLTLMIAHHDGAIEMVKELEDQPGSAYDPVLNEFISDITNDQAAEIERMNALLTNISSDPRASLTAGLFDAEEAILNMRLLKSLRKPVGFYDPANPARRGAEERDKDGETEGEDSGADNGEKYKTIEEDAENKRYPMLSFANTDMAFHGNILVTGSYHGFNIYLIGEEGSPTLLTSVICPGGQGDVSIVDNILIYSVEESRSRLDCGLQGVRSDASPERFRGLRIFDISDLSRPRQVGAVQTCRGSHTHSVVNIPSLEDQILVYSSGIRGVREKDELERCIEDIPGDERTALFRIDVIEIPKDDPSRSRILASPAVFADPETGTLAGLWRGGDHGDDSQETNITDHCHDITVFPLGNIAAGACSGNGILFDITNPIEPKRIDVVTDEGFAYWHSATFNNKGNKVLFTDEWGGGGRARCRAWDPLDWGADAIYDVIDNKLEFQSHFKMSAPQLETENCVAHNGSIVPVPGRDIFVQAWYQGGISVIDFTDSSKPIEIAYFDRGPIMEDELIVGGYWSAYYYEGTIYGTEITRGLDTFKLVPSEHLSENEIAAAELASPLIGPDRVFNPQQQVPMTWPPVPVVARAYIDQLTRGQVLKKDTADLLAEMLGRVEAALERGGDKQLSRQLRQFNLSSDVTSGAAEARDRLKRLDDTLKEIAKVLNR